MAVWVRSSVAEQVGGELVATSDETIVETHFGFPRVGAHVRGFSGLKYFGCQKLVQSHRLCVRDHLLGLMRSQRRHEPRLARGSLAWMAT